MTPIVSIIIPVYNAAPYLYACLDSVRMQSCKNIEVIVINDCSTDNSRYLIEQYIKEYNDVSIKLLDFPVNQGQSAARNCGLKNAIGKYVYLLDSDDDIVVNCINDLVYIAESDNLSLVLGENYIVSNGEKKIVRVDVEKDRLYGKEILDTFTQRKWYNQPWNKLVRRDIIENNDLYFAEGHILEDELWSFQLATRINSMGILKEPTYNYYVRQGSTLNSVLKEKKRWDEFLCINALLRTYIIDNNLSENDGVSRYFLTNLLVNIDGFRICGSLSYNIFKNIIDVNYVDVYQLYVRGYLSKKECFAYLYFNLPKVIGYRFYSFLCILWRLKKKRK
ncbi:glycosyltransferase family 2 protein [Bacteroides faecium]|uniref:Glycosyltransferase n=1 Tax=Bacteroides faecium TaxID=2715212 RepID=A0A6H0KP35_9BACE|nr:glycosyltransferase family 2 protein [Bacteroides faecium]QIU95142.1 glycosyltransferase [Bacteroides faecium]